MSHRSMSPARAALAVCTTAVVSLAATGCMGMGGMAAMSPQMQQNHMAIHAFSMATHMGEIEEAQLARTKSQNPAVQQFAQEMITEHTAAMQRAQQMMMKMGMKMDGAAAMSTDGSMDMEGMKAMLMSNPYSRPVMEGHMQAMQTLRAASGMQFDHAYMQRQVAAHSYALENLDRMMRSMGMMADGAMAGSMQGTDGMNHANMDHGNMNMEMPATPAGVMMLHKAERAMVAEHLQKAQQRMQSMRAM